MRFRIRAEARAALLGEGEVVVGRSSYASLVLEDASVSRLHAAVRARGDEIEIEDLGSSNGTWVNGKRISEPKRIAASDDVKVGSVKLHVEIINPREALTTGQRIRFTEDAEGTDERPTVVGPGFGGRRE